MRRQFLSLFLCIFFEGGRAEQSYLRRRLTWDSVLRPVMHTFFTELTPVGSSLTSAGMTANAHNTMINVWKESWQEAGWQTRILTMDDAKQHPEFDKLDAFISNFTMSEYDKACYYRWIAIAAVGGGWMSDYDTLPLNNFTNQGFNLPFQGAFTAYENHVPSLLSGSANEWSRMIRRLVEYARIHPRENGETPSDMFSLLGLKETYPSIFIYRLQVVGGNVWPEADVWTEEQCQQKTPRKLRAIHFSHAMIDQEWIKAHPEDKLDDRPSIARRWLENWLTHCHRKQLQKEVQDEDRVALEAAIN